MPRRIWSKARRIWRVHVRPLLIVVLVLTSFRSAIADWNDVPTGSMKPSILEGDRILVNKLAYGLKVPFTTWHLMHWNAPQRGEIVVFNSPADGLRLVKRVVGLPGDTVLMIDNRLYINGQPMAYEPLDTGTIRELPSSEQPAHGYARETLGQAHHPVMSTPANAAAMRTFGPIKVPQGEYFVMGDNRDNSNDSRYIGTVKLDEIVGRSSYVALSLNYNNHFIPRWDRFFKALP
jgi:signal peptidase I